MVEVTQSWTDFKTTCNNKNLYMQMEESSVQYFLWATEALDTYDCVIVKENPKSADQIDFEDNYQSLCNQAISSGEDHVMDSEEIRDTAETYSSVSDERGFVPKTVIVENNLDAQVSVQVQGARDSAFTIVHNIGSAFNVPASDKDFATLTDYFPYLRVCIIASSAPTSGDIDVYIES